MPTQSLRVTQVTHCNPPLPPPSCQPHPDGDTSFTESIAGFPHSMHVRVETNWHHALKAWETQHMLSNSCAFVRTLPMPWSLSLVKVSAGRMDRRRNVQHQQTSLVVPSSQVHAETNNSPL